MIAEGVHRFTAKRGAPVKLALPPLNYGAHSYHHVGMPGTVIVREHIVREMMIDVMLGLWNDSFRKQLIINNHCKRLNEIDFRRRQGKFWFVPRYFSHEY